MALDLRSDAYCGFNTYLYHHLWQEESDSEESEDEDMLGAALLQGREFSDMDDSDEEDEVRMNS